MPKFSPKESAIVLQGEKFIPCTITASVVRTEADKETTTYEVQTRKGIGLHVVEEAALFSNESEVEEYLNQAHKNRLSAVMESFKAKEAPPVKAKK